MRPGTPQEWSELQEDIRLGIEEGVEKPLGADNAPASEPASELTLWQAAMRAFEAERRRVADCGEREVVPF